MIQKKVCMLGAFAVGKTSLVSRYVHTMFREEYRTTLGVKVDKKRMNIHGQDTSLLIWDLAGEDGLVKIPPSYLAGASGVMMVVDGTRAATRDTVTDIHDRHKDLLADVPIVVALNKCDRTHDWEFGEGDLYGLRRRNWIMRQTSALSGHSVEELFVLLGRAMLACPMPMV